MSTASFGVSDVPGVSVANRAREPAAAPGPAAYRDEDFPGCESFHLPAGGLEHYEGRLEFWDGDTETAWKVCEPTSLEHEGPSRRLVEMATWITSLRGSRIACFGSADLLRVDATGRKRWLMQADEVLYLHPDRVRLQGPVIDVDADPLPDVALEVDHTTDVRKRKLGIYKESGFPEVWVLVPWEASVREAGLTIHVRRGDVYREEPESRAFPGWRAEEIHRALTEAPVSEGAWRALERVARAMGAREGTKPEDNLLMRSHSAKVRTQGHREGHAEGHAEGRREGRAEGRHEGLAQGRSEMLAGKRAHGAEGPGHRSGAGCHGGPGAAPGTVERSRDGGSAGVRGRGRLPATARRAGRRGALRRRPAVRAGVGGTHRAIRCTPWRALVRLSGHLALKPGRSGPFSPGDGDGTRPTVPCFTIRAHERSSRPRTHAIQGRNTASQPGSCAGCLRRFRLRARSGIRLSAHPGQ